MNSQTYQSLEDLERNKDLISDLQKDENGNDIRIVNGVAIQQIEEKTEADIKKNYIINLWRMRNLK